jgi:acyl carrier protein
MRQTLDEIKVRCSKQEIDSPLERARLGSFDLRRQVVSRGLPLKGRPLSVDSIVIAEASGGAQARSMEFGPRWQGLKWVGLGEREGLALLELPRAFEDDLESYRLHPALLDFATSFLRLFESEGSYLPLSYRQLQVMRPLPGRVYSHVRLSDSGSERQGMTLGFDVTLFDEEGRALVEVKEFTVMRLDDVGKLSSLSGASALLPDDPTVHTHAGLLEGDLAMGLLSAEGVDVFDRILASGLRRVIVSTRDLYTRIEKSRASSAALMGGATGDDGVKPKHPRPKLMTPYAAPRSEMEQKLAEIWQEVLGVEQVGVHDNFFDLGGDSLLIAQVHTRFRQSFEFDLSAANLLQYPTIADLTQHLAELSSVEHAPIELVQERVERQKAALKRRRQSLRKKKVA